MTSRCVDVLKVAEGMLHLKGHSFFSAKSVGLFATRCRVTEPSKACKGSKWSNFRKNSVTLSSQHLAKFGSRWRFFWLSVDHISQSRTKAEERTNADSQLSSASARDTTNRVSQCSQVASSASEFLSQPSSLAHSFSTTSSHYPSDSHPILDYRILIVSPCNADPYFGHYRQSSDSVSAFALPRTDPNLDRASHIS